jgi:hypothetical protein
MEVGTGPESVLCKDQPNEGSLNSLDQSATNRVADIGSRQYSDVRLKARPINSKLRGFLYSSKSLLSDREHSSTASMKAAPKTILKTSQNHGDQSEQLKESRTRLKKVYFKVIFTMLTIY